MVVKDATSPVSEDNAIWLSLKKGPLRVAIVGAGNWGTTAAMIVARNASASYIFENTVKMWCFEEMFEGKKLTETINTEHENKKYLPGVKLPETLVADPDLISTVDNADLLVFVLPHQFVDSVCKQLKGKVKPFVKAISLIKGVSIDKGLPVTMSDLISSTLSIRCCALSGANVAKDIANGQFSECTLGYRDTQKDIVAIWQLLFDTPQFRITPIPDVKGVEICGAVKNVIAIAAGFCDGMGLGTNTKAAMIRLGVCEMKLFATLFFDDVLQETFDESCGFADTITTCFGGRNVRCAKEFVKRGCKDSWDTIEKDLLGGQKIQGHLTAMEVHEVLEHNKLSHLFPLFEATYNIAFKGAPAELLLRTFEEQPMRPIKQIQACHRVEVDENLLQLREAVRRRMMGRSFSDPDLPM